MTEERITYLVTQAQQGNVKAFEELIAVYEYPLFGFALSISGGNHATASDIYQEAVLKAFLNIKKFRGDSSFKRWLWTIARNEFINFVKSPRTNNRDIAIEDMQGFEPGDESECNESELDTEMRKQNLRKLISMLSVNYQEIITLIDLQEMSYEEAAQLLDISIDNVKVRVHRAREKLSELVMEHTEIFL